MKNNKGFSLVELIIVIAIMAVLVGVLAPTYLQYVEKSRKSNDVSTVDSIINAIEVAAVDPEVTDFTEVTVTLSDTQTLITATSGNAKMIDAVEKIVGCETATDVHLKSKQWGSDITFLATAGADGKVAFSYPADATTGNTAFKAYATSITKLQ